MDKKIYIIIILSLIIIGLVWFIFARNSQSKVVFEQIRTELSQANRSTAIVESELSKSVGEVTQLEADNLELTNDNIELTDIVDNITAGSQETKNIIGEYGGINRDLADFIQQNSALE